MRNKYPLYGRDANGTIRPVGAPKMGDFGNPKMDPLAPVTPVAPQTFEESRYGQEFPVHVTFPKHTYAPAGARTVDLRRVVNFASSPAPQELMSFVCLPGANTVIYYYSLVLFASPGTTPPANILWFPAIDGDRILQYHGSPGTAESPNPATILDAPTAFDFSSTGLIRCQILLQPNQVLKWFVINNSGDALNMGVRMTGYVDLTQQVQATKFGD
jgi:hypothetical protein